MFIEMSISEAARSDLYTGLRDVLGPERAETPMSAIPLHDLDEVATKRDIAELRTDMAELRTELKTDIADLRSDLTDELDSLRKSTTTWVLGLAVSIIGAMTTLMVVALNVG